MTDTTLTTWPDPSDPDDVDVDKNVDIDFNFDSDITFNLDVNVEKDKDIDINIDSNVNLEGNVAEANVSVEAIGENTLAELDLVVLTTDNLSSIEVSALAVTGD